MTHRENNNHIVERTKIMAKEFGRSNNFVTLSLSLSLSLSKVLIYNNIRGSLPVAGALTCGFLCRNARKAALFFCSPTETDKYSNNIIYSLT